MDDEGWRELHRSRFPGLTFDCGNRLTPGVVEGPHLRDWSRKPTTADQLRIERYVDRFDLRAKRILHIGVGNSGLAKRFHRRTGEIVGTSIDAPELTVARSLGLPNYRVVEHNKYSALQDDVPGQFHFIVDNNLTSPCCCVHHLAQLIHFLDAKLAEEGQIVTDAEGLAWLPDGSNPRWSFDFDDLVAAAAVAGLSAYRIDQTVYVLARTEPAEPAWIPLLRHSVRRVTLFPQRTLRVARGALSAAKRP
jgi:hypothetical protein